MSEQFKTAYAMLLEQRAQGLYTDAQVLAASGRTDEANLKKAARNIYGIFAQLLIKADDPAAYEAQFDKLRLIWRDAHQRASTHGDFARVAIEEAKLSALDDAEDAYRALQSEVSIT